MERSPHQSCPLSMPLYVLTEEAKVLVNIRTNLRIHGLVHPGSKEELKLSQFADDTILLLTDDESINETFHDFDQY